MSVGDDRKLHDPIGLARQLFWLGGWRALGLSGRTRRFGFHEQFVDEDRHGFHLKLTPKPALDEVVVTALAGNAPGIAVPRSADKPIENSCRAGGDGAGRDARRRC